MFFMKTIVASEPIITVIKNSFGYWTASVKFSDAFTIYEQGRSEEEARKKAVKAYQDQVRLQQIYHEADRRGECRSCAAIKILDHGFGPSHEGSRNCKSGSIASGGTIAHCMCDVCF